ncbi:MAG: HEPN domain-containing protein [Dehalococcoidia bacterium]
MNGTVRQWIEKADADLATARRELRAESQVNYDAVCFHDQQCLEKMLKGALIHFGAKPPHIHDLAELSRLLSSIRSDWSFDERDMHFVSQGAVVFRYPGESAMREDAEESYAICQRVREELLGLVGAEP